MSFSQPLPNVPSGNVFANIGPNMPVQGIQIISKPVCTTRILILSGFAAELKTRDLLLIFAEWEDQGGGYRIKWIDDRSAYIVFNDAIVAKRAFLATLANMPPCLAGTDAAPPACLLPYTGPETDSVIATTANRPRSRSNAAVMNGHARKGSASSVNNAAVGGVPITALMGNQGHARRESQNQPMQRPVFMNGQGLPHNMPVFDSSGNTHVRNGSFNAAIGQNSANDA